MGRWTEGTFLSFDGLPLFYRFYSAGPNSDLFLILHGQGEHSGRYDKYLSFLEGENLSIAAFDHRGHGRSGGAEVHVERFEDYLRDVSALTDFLRDHFEIKQKIFLFGNSLGGLMAIHWARQFPDRLAALILSTPCLGLLLPNWIIHANHFLNLFLPRMIYHNPIYPPHLTHDSAEILKYRNDPWVKRKISVRLLDEMVKACEVLEKETVYPFPFPVYIFEAGEEKIVDPGKIKSFYEKIKAPRKELKYYANSYHEIFNEIEQGKAFGELKACIADARKISH